MLDKQQLYDLVIEGLPVALFVVNSDYRIVEFNPAAEQITGLRRRDVLGRRCADIFSSNLCEHECPLLESEKICEPCVGRKALIRGRDGEEVPVLFSSRAILDDNGRMVYGIEVFRDATDVRELEIHKRNLISLFTHDLKAPVAISGGFVDRLLQGKAGPLNEKQTGYLQAVHREISRLEQYIFSFLDIARIESGQMKLELSPCDFVELVREIVTGFEVRAAEKRIELQLELPLLSGLLMADRLQISRVVTNLLDNAIKYSEENSRVLLRIQENENRLILEIRDQGPGIGTQDQVHIFDHFYRIDDQRRDIHGTGLGLAAVKAIIEAHSGRVWMHSIPGQGSSFFISLPKGLNPASEP